MHDGRQNAVPDETRRYLVWTGSILFGGDVYGNATFEEVAQSFAIWTSVAARRNHRAERGVLELKPMKLKTALLLAAALLSGAVGGIVSRLITTDDLRNLRFGPVRASRFDLVGANGKTLATLGREGEFGAVLSFLDQHDGQPRARLGILDGPSAPVLEFRSFDGKRRLLAILLAPDDNASVQLSDKAGRTRWISTDESAIREAQ
jgi:hypothetical protein